MIEKNLDFFYGDNDSEVLTLIHPGHFYKTAEYSDELRDYVKELKEKVDRTYALVNALSAGEYFGPNRNGDYFPEEVLQKYHKTFEAMGGIYRHHVNKDPKKSMGRIVFAFYNKAMHRVELVLELSNSRAQDVIEALHSGKLPAVSMGCFIPNSNNNIILQDLSKKPIEDVKLDDKVLTHTGKVRTVTELHRRDYEGLVYTINPVGKFRDPITATKEHPWLVVEPEVFYNKDEKHRVIRNKNISLDQAVWKTSEELTGEELLLWPKPKTENEVPCSIEKAKLLGWYLAEGYTGINGNKTEYSVNVEDQIISEIEKVANKYDNLVCHINARKHSELARSIAIYDNSFKDTCLKYCGKYSHKKKLLKEIFSWPYNAKLAFIGAYMSGDGFFHEGQAYLSSCNKQLLEQVQWLALSINLKSVLGVNEHKAGKGFSNEDTTEYFLRFFGDCNEALSRYCAKVPKENKQSQSGKGGPYEYEDFLLVKIAEITSKEYSGPVFNFEVDDDNSYVVDKWAVHNCRVPFDVCSICGNRAKTRATYCDHLNNHMNKVLPDGQRVYAVNTMPKFFDISKVTIPAEPTASFIKMLFVKKASAEIDFESIGNIKTASIYEMDKTAGLDSTAAINKTIVGKVDAVSEDPKNLILRSQKRLSADQIEKLSKYPLSTTLSTLAGLRICPVPQDFQKLALYSIGRQDLADALEKEAYVFSIDENIGTTDIADAISLDDFNEKIAKEIISDDVYEMAMTKPLIVSRILEKVAMSDYPFSDSNEVYDNTSYKTYPSRDKERSLISKVFLSKKQEPSISPHKNPIVPLGLLGALYVGYAKFMNSYGQAGNVPKFRRFMLKHPWLAPVFLAAAGTAATSAAQNTHYENTPLFADHLNKTGGAVDSFVRNLFVSVPVSYYLSYKSEAKAQQGVPISHMQNFIRKHPMLTSIAGAGLTTGAESAARKYMKPGRNILKVSSIVSRLDIDDLDSIYKQLID